MKTSKDIKAGLALLPPILMTIAAGLWDGLFGYGKAAFDSHTLFLTLSFISATISLFYFSQSKKITLVIGISLTVNGLWAVLLIGGLIFGLAFNGPA